MQNQSFGEEERSLSKMLSGSDTSYEVLDPSDRESRLTGDKIMATDKKL